MPDLWSDKSRWFGLSVLVHALIDRFSSELAYNRIQTRCPTMRFPGHSTNWPRDFRRLPAGVQLQTSRASNRSSRLFYMWHQAITAYLKCSSLDPDRNLHALVFHSVISAPGPWFPATPGLIPITLNCTAYTASQSTLTFGPENPSTFHLR